jgi:hypothetical protein
LKVKHPHKHLKHASPWWSHSLAQAAWPWVISQCPQGILFATGCPRAGCKVICELVDLAEKYFFLVNTSILYYFDILPNSIAPKQSICASPTLPLPVATPLLHLLCRTGMLLVSCCVIFICWRPSKATTYFHCHFFSSSIHHSRQRDNTPPHVPSGCLSSSMPLPLSMPTFDWLLCPPIKLRPSKAKGPPISLFFLSINIPPQTMGNRPPHTFRPGLASSPMHPLKSTPSSI